MYYKKFLIFSLLLLFSNGDVFSQELIEIKPNNTSHKFPFLKYQNKPDIQEKVNAFLQLKYLLHLPNDYKNNPFEKVFNREIVANDYEFINWKQRKLNDNIICIQLDQKLNGKSVIYLEHFDKRTGDFFDLYDLFNNNGKQKLHEEISKKIKQLVDIGKVPSLQHNVNISYRLLEEQLEIVFIKITNEKLILTYDALKPFLSAFGKNLFFPSEDIIRRPDLSNKLLRAESDSFMGKDIYHILILKVATDGKTKIYKWRDKRKKADKYTEAFVKNDSIKADDFVWDSLQEKKVHAMNKLHLKRLDNDSGWKGEIQSGSMVQYLTFKEY
ncbi:hypothetical protein [Tenacibaculum agarivorans]|uniref:hypothetical protein n=1 Tax=Tenacibaculum agarivorans TaxID=1908389 RepID=UPI00094BA194|nr:hypothetical protein [Tenacibaculum agarivorans]